MAKINLDALFKYLDEKFAELRDEMITQDQWSSLVSSVDRIAKQQQTFTEEMAIIHHKMGYVETWAIKAGRKIKLDFEAAPVIET